MAWSVSVSCRLDCTIEQARAILMDPATLQHVATPILRFRPIDPPHWPAPWQEGEYLALVRLFGMLPLGHQWIRTSFPPLPDDDGTGGFAVRDNGSGSLARVWDHWVFARPQAGARTSYTDRVHVEAGLLTPLVWAFAQGFYRWRQARLRKLAVRR